MLTQAHHHAVQLTTALSICVLIMRLTLGGMILAHGLNKFFGGGKIAGTAAWFESIGMKPGKLNALMAASTTITFRPAIGLAVAAIIGVGGALLQLAVFFRPPKDAG